MYCSLQISIANSGRQHLHSRGYGTSSAATSDLEMSSQFESDDDTSEGSVRKLYIITSVIKMTSSASDDISRRISVLSDRTFWRINLSIYLSSSSSSSSFILKTSPCPRQARVRRLPQIKSLHISLKIATQNANQAASCHLSHTVPTSSYSCPDPLPPLNGNITEGWLSILGCWDAALQSIINHGTNEH